MRREVIARIPLRGGMHRFLTVFARQLGYRVGEIAVHHRRREFGQSKYGWRRLPEGLVDLVRVTLFGKQLIATAANDRQLYEIETTVNAVRPV